MPSVVTHGDSGNGSHDGPFTIVFPPVDPTILVTSGANLGVDGDSTALESDIDATFSSAFVLLSTTDTSSGTGTSSYQSGLSDLSVVLSTVLQKAGNFVVVEGDISFDLVVDPPGLVTSAPATTTPKGDLIPCTFSFSSVQAKLTAT